MLGKTKQCVKKVSYQMHKHMKQTTENTLTALFPFGILVTHHRSVSRQLCGCLTATLGSHSPGSSAARSPGLGSAAPGSGEGAAPAPGSGSSTLVTVKCGISGRRFAPAGPNSLPRDLASGLSRCLSESIPAPGRPGPGTGKSQAHVTRGGARGASRTRPPAAVIALARVRHTAWPAVSDLEGPARRPSPGRRRPGTGQDEPTVHSPLALLHIGTLSHTGKIREHFILQTLLF